MTALYNGQADIQDMAAFFFSKSFADIKKLAQTKNLAADIEDGTIYIENKLVRMDVNMMGEQASFIINLETRIAYNVLYSQKTYIEMNLDELEGMQQKIAKHG